MPSPHRRVALGSQALSFGVIQHFLDASAQSRCRFGLRLPDRLKDAEHMAGLDRRHRHLPDLRAEGSQRLAPLPPVLLVAPARLNAVDVRVGSLAEGHSCRPASFGNGVQAGTDRLPRLGCRGTRVGQRYVARGAKAHFAAPAGAFPHEDPRSGALGDIEIQSITIRVAPRFLGGRNGSRAQFDHSPPASPPVDTDCSEHQRTVTVKPNS